MFFDRLYSDTWPDYELIDAGGGKKLERFGKIITIRPEIQAYFRSEIPFGEWEKKAHASFIENKGRKGSWKFHRQVAPDWEIDVLGLKARLEFTQFKHVGIFPEQFDNWKFIREQLRPEDKFLNLFAYTGLASLVARSSGAEVTHVDSVKQLVSWSKENMILSELEDIRWMIDDALKFAQREAKRGNSYQGIVMDPPAFGLGAKGEKWILEERLPELLAAAEAILDKNGFLVVNTYSPKITAENLYQTAKKTFSKRRVEVKELWMKSRTDKDLYFGNVLRVTRV